MAINLDHVTEQITVTDTATNADLTLVTKGTGAVNLNTGNGTAFRVSDFGGTIVGGLAVYAGSSAQNTVYVAPYGSGAGVNLLLASKGTSPVIFGTNTSNNATASEQFRVAHTASAVNYVQVTGATTGNFPVVSGQGSDTNIGVNFSAKGAARFNFYSQGGVSNRQFSVGGNGATAVNSIDVSGSTTGNGPVIQTQGSDTNIDINYTAKGTGVHKFGNTGGEAFRTLDAGTTSGSAYWTIQGASGGFPFLSVDGTNPNCNAVITSKGTGSVRFYTGGTSGVEQLRVAHTASAVNYVQVTGATTGNSPTISTQGSDSNINLILATKGSGDFVVSANSGYQFVVGGAASVVNNVRIIGGATGVAPLIQALGSDTNIPLVLQPKGTGALQAQQTDSTATGGNARGVNAIDLQTGRDLAAQVASGAYSVISGGYGNRATSTYSATLSGGANINSSFQGVIAGGTNNQISSLWSGIFSGNSNVANGYYNFIGGGWTNSATSSSAVTTQSGTMNATTAVTLSSSNASIKVGQYVSGTSIANNTYVAAISGTSLTLSQAASGSSTSTLSFYTPHGVVVGGGNNQATGSYSFIGGGGDAGTAGNRNVASGDWSVVGGGRANTASGVGAFVGGGGADGTNVGTNTASGTFSAVVCGFANSATGTGSFVANGYSNAANGNYSSVLGGARGNARSIQGNFVLPACVVPIADASGITQAALLVLAVQTTDATATVLRSNTAAAGTSNQVIMPNNSAYFFTGEVVAGVTGGGNTKGWTIEGVIKRGANAASTALVGTPTVTSTYADAGASTWVIAVTADTTNGGLAVTFTGQASTTIRTVAQIRTTEMTY